MAAVRSRLRHAPPEVWARIVLAVVVGGWATTVLWQSQHLTSLTGTATDPGPGTLPAFIACLVIVLLAADAVRTATKSQPRRPPHGHGDVPAPAATRAPSRVNVRPAVFMLGLILSAVCVVYVGAVPAVVLLAAWCLGLVERRSWTTVIVGASAVGAAFYVVFVLLLEVPIPPVTF